MDDGRTDNGVTGILIAHLGAFGSGELKSMQHGKITQLDFHVPNQNYSALLKMHDTCRRASFMYC